MTGRRGTETEFELATIQRLEKLDYRWLAGPDLVRDPSEVVLGDALRDSLARRYEMLPPDVLASAVGRIARPDGADTLQRNKDFHLRLVEGFEVFYEKGGKRVPVHIHPIDWEHAERNDFVVVNQLPVHGANDRRPDLVVYVNGLPLVVFELKNPYSEKPTVDEALNQIAHYRRHISQLFETNALVVVSDGNETLHGMWTAGREWYAPWKSVDGTTIAPGILGSMKVLIEGLFPKERLLAYVRQFVVFETANERVEKKGARYHQFFATRAAVDRAKAAFRTGGDRRLGVVWHTTGSGKSLTMVFLVGILRKLAELENPTIVLQVDRVALDEQLHDQFVAARSLVGDVKHAESREELRDLLASGGGEVVFTTIEKFSLKTDESGHAIETEHPVLSTRANVVVIADEAHRSQYGFEKGCAKHLADALPNAKRIGFTATPISFGGADTVEVFGNYIHTYDIRQSQEDRATVPIWYAPRLARLHLAKADVDAGLADVVAEHPEAMTDLERRKSRWAQIAAAAGARERVAEVAEDLLAHFLDRSKTLAGKAIVVCMTRENCVRMADALRALPGCPELAVVMTGNLGEDPESFAPYMTTKPQRDAIKERMKKPDDPLKIAVVCDMWLTGTDIPCLHTLYLDKPLRGHNVIQAISRVNRVFRDKPHGLVVDYIGIGDELRQATKTYTQGGGHGDPAPDVGEQARPVFLASLDEVRACLPAGGTWSAWRRMSPIEFEDLHALAYGLSEALGTTFTLDLMALLSAPLAFTMFDVEDVSGEPQTDPLALLEALRRYADHVHVFCQAGYVAVPPKDQRLFAWLESSVLDVRRPGEDGVFHPKVWVLRFESEDRPVFYRVLVGTRNLTFDRSWDTLLSIEGETREAGAAATQEGRSLANFVAALPAMAVRQPVSPRLAGVVELVASELRRTKFAPPDPFASARFRPLGDGIDGAKSWEGFRARVDRLLVMSPFLSPKTLVELSEPGRGDVLVSRAEALAEIPSAVLRRFGDVFALAPEAEAEHEESGGDDADELPRFTGLHAKLYVADQGAHATVWTGSANATGALRGASVEMLVELEGMKSRCGIEAVLGRAEDRGGLRDLLRRYPIPDVDVPGDAVCRLLENRIAAVRTLVAEAALVARVAPSAGLDTFDVTLTVPGEMWRSVPGLSDLRVRPSTLARDRALTVPDEGGDVRFPGGTFDSLTSFFVVKAVVVEQDRSMEAEFAVNVPVEGMPADRRNRLMRATLGSRSKVLRFLMLLLSDGGVDARRLLQPDRATGSGADGSGGFLTENDLLESMLRALDCDPQRIDRIARLVEDLKSAPDGAAMLPDGLESLLAPILEVRRGLSP